MGWFLTSAMNRALDTNENNFDHVNYEAVYREFDAQVRRFQEIVGKLPDYIHGHAYGTRTTMKAMRAIASKYNRPLSSDVLEHLNVRLGTMEWYRFGNEMQEQFKDDVKTCVLEDKSGFLNSEYGCLVTHCGYMDMKLLELSSFTVYRMKDLEAMTCAQVRQWVADNHIQLITWRDLQDQMIKSGTEKNGDKA